jgi:uncharacterized protein (DUF2336 family)
MKMPMPNQTNVISVKLLDELEDTLAHGTLARRVDLLRSITDLFCAGGVDYSDGQLELFDDVFACLVQNIEVSAKALLANRLAPHPAAPPRIIHTLAFDDIIEVAAPVLSQSGQLDDDALIENARTKSQAHMLAISRRATLSGAVTDILVARGNMEVVTSAAGNPGAEFSETGYATLVERAEDSDELAATVGMRASIPRHHLLKLIAKASDTVREKLKSAHPDTREAIDGAVKQVAAAAQKRSAAGDIDVTAARAHVGKLHEAGQLDENQVAQFARDSKFNETNAAIALLTNVPFVTVETMMIESRSEGVMVLAKVLNFSWATVKAILDMRGGLPSDDEAFTKVSYERLKSSTAQQVLRFHKMQQQPAMAS